MNKDRRKRIQALEAQLSKLVLPDMNLEDIKSDIEGIKDEEQEYYDNMPESLQSGDRGQRAEEVVGLLGEAEDELQELIDAFEKIESIIEKLQDAGSE